MYLARMNTQNSGKQRQAILWGRFSSDKQSDGDSIDSQNRYNRDCAKRNGIEIIKEYFDEGISVKNGPTPNFLLMLKDLSPGVGIICRDLDRISRGHCIDAMAFLKNEIVASNHFVITSTDGVEYNQETINQSSTLVVGSMKATIAFGENEKRIRGVRDAKESAIALARKGLPSPLGAWLPSHLKYNFETKQYDVKNDIKDIIQRIYSEYSKGKGTSSIARGLNDDGTLTFVSKKAGQWTRSTISQMLRYQGTIGTLVIKGERIVNAFPPAISEQLFYKVQSMFEGHTKRHGNYTSDKVNNIFRGVCHCSICGNPVKVYKHTYLGCSGYRDKKHDANGNACSVKNLVPFGELEKSLLEWFVPIAKEELLGKDDNISIVDTLNIKLKSIETKINETFGLLDGELPMPMDKVRERLSKLELERRTIENDISSNKSASSSKASMPEIFDELSNITRELNMNNQEMRKRVACIVPTLIKDIVVDITDKLYPSFHVVLVNGKAFNYSLTMVSTYGVKAYTT